MRIVAGKFKGRQLETPKSFITRPTQTMVREAVFNICQNEIEGAYFLDLFAGSGSMGFEALSRGAKSVSFVEKDPNAIRSLRQNIENLKVQDETTLFAISVHRAIDKLQKAQAKFDLIYVDPPYDQPFDLSSVAPLMKKSSTLFLEKRFGRESSHDFLHLHCVSSRRFGSSHLFLFQLSS